MAGSKKRNKYPLSSILIEDSVIVEPSDYATELYNKSRYGIILDDRTLQLSLTEGLFLFEKGKIEIKGKNGRVLTKTGFTRKASKKDPNFQVKYAAYFDLRKRGYIVKTALKFGADFRVYNKGIKPGEDHAKWVVFAVHESSGLRWHDFSSKNRIAHSTKKKLLLAIVDEENELSYWESSWIKP